MHDSSLDPAATLTWPVEEALTWRRASNIKRKALTPAVLNPILLLPPIGYVDRRAC